MTANPQEVDIIALEICYEDDKLMMINAYSPPPSSTWSKEELDSKREGLITIMREIIARADNDRSRLLIVGDFNLKSIDWEAYEAKTEDFWTCKFVDLILETFLYQHVKQATRMREGDVPSMLDLIFTRKEEEIFDIQYLPPLGKSDHVFLGIKYAMRYKLEENKEVEAVEKPDFRRGHYGDLRNFFSEYNWTDLMLGKEVNEMYGKFCEIYDKGTKKFIPKQRCRTRKQDWFNRNCERARDRKTQKWNQYRKRPNPQTYQRYKDARNNYTAVRREAERNFEKGIADKCKTEPGLFYKFINNKLQVKDNIQRLKMGNRFTEDEKEMCETLNEKFQSVFVQNEIFREPDTIRIPENNIEHIEVSRDEVEKMLKELGKNKAAGPDGVSPWVLRECASELSIPLHLIFQASLCTGIVADGWKQANIVPIYKSGSREDPLNYRPVSLTSVIVKVLEKLIKTKWVEHLERNDIISDRQYGFRSGRSCVPNLLSFYDRATEILQERDGWVDCIYLDLKKAFDRVPHKRLFWKLENIGGVTGKLLSWMKNFLTDRKMRAVIRGNVSEWRNVTSGVPQGSVLAPVMFIVYINDLPVGIQNYMNMFADDAKIIGRIRNLDDCHALQEDLDKISIWSTTWQMEFNVNKCHVMECGIGEHRPHTTYILCEKSLKNSDKERDLGVVLDRKLSPEDHIKNIVQGAYAMLSNFRIAFKYMDGDILKKLFMTFVRPKLEYAAVVWCPYLKKHINKLEKVQRHATKWLPELKGKSYEERLEALNMPKLEDRRKRGDMITTYKIVTGIDKIDREDFLRPGISRTRGHRFKLAKHRCRRNIRKFTFANRVVDGWNKLSEKVVEAKTVSSFKALYDKECWEDGTPRA
ncbi:uncharacterized protein [Procambarus clarkii]|uniref:uncharacterized protein n=1 Tax=Procambarus clarkii TaxID=6728 RepID=UPI003742D633